MIKDGIRVLGIDDSPFEFSEDRVLLTGVVYRGTEFAEDIATTSVKVDGADANDRLIELHEKCSNTGQIKAVLTDGISFAGFNLIDIHEVAEKLGKPVIAVTSNKPDPEEFRDTMESTGNYENKFEKLSQPTEIELKDGTTFIQFAGCSEEEAEEIIRKSIIHGLTPEPIRLAHMIGRSLEGQLKN